MKTSTTKDIEENIQILTKTAHTLLAKPTEDEDWWESHTIGDKEYDINIFIWELPNGDPVKIATAHPVTHNESGYVETDMTNYVRLVTQPL
jgi:hypothetical protein